MAFGLGLCAAWALGLWTASAHAADAHAGADAHAPAEEHKSIKPSLAPVKPSKGETETATGAAPAAPAKGRQPPPGLEDLRQKLNEKVAEVRKSQEARTVTVNNPAPHGAAGHAPAASARHRSPAGAAGAHAGPSAHGGHWAYGGEGGPEDWGKLKPEFSLCSIGTRQSPIDIRDGIRVELDPVKFDYRASGFNVVDNGHTVQVNVSAGNTILVGQRRFELVQFHFHRPSEERINGRQFEMVAHLVHKDLDGRLAVVAVLMDQGRQHPLVQQVWNNLPLEKNSCRAWFGPDRSQPAAARGPPLLHLHGLADHAALQRRRAVDRAQAAGGGVLRPARGVLAPVPDECPSHPARGGPAHQGIQLTRRPPPVRAVAGRPPGMLGACALSTSSRSTTR